MGLIPQIKCSRCDRNYSGLRSRCPYCGARRRKKGKRASDADNATWKLIIGILLMVVLIAAVVVILVTSLSGEKDPGKVEDGDKEQIDLPNTDGIFDDGVDSVDGKDPEGDDGDDGNDDQDPPVVDDPVTPPAPQVQSVAIYTIWGTATTDFTVKAGNSETITVKIAPEGVEVVPVWESSDTSVFEVVPTDLTGTTVKVTAIGPGTAKLIVTVDNKTCECIVRVN